MSYFDTIKIEGSSDNGDNHLVKVDRNGGISTIGEYAYHINEGNFFTVSDYADGLAADSSKYWLTDVFDTKEVHWFYLFEADRPGKLSFYIFPTVSNPSVCGTPLISSNNNMNSSNVAVGAYFCKDPDIETEGIFILRRLIGSEGANPVGGTGGTVLLGTKNILKYNTKFLIKFVPNDNNTSCTLLQYFYELDI